MSATFDVEWADVMIKANCPCGETIELSGLESNMAIKPETYFAQEKVICEKCGRIYRIILEAKQIEGIEVKP